jgi:hypothetical protein
MQTCVRLVESLGDPVPTVADQSAAGIRRREANGVKQS